MTGESFCRDCLSFGPQAGANARRCQSCGSPRLLVHAERDQLPIAHIDCDAFYASVEKRDNPALLDQPLIVGGARRGVVSTCCYIARTFGVRSAMPMFRALALCPHAVVVKPDMAKYARIGRQVKQMMLDLTPLVEPVSIDEAFLDLSGTQALHHSSPAITLARLARRIEDDIGISVSIGLSYCKFLAKLASDLDKPRGFTVIGRAEAVEFLAPRPVGLIWGVGKVTQERLAREGLRLIGDIQARPLAQLLKTCGEEGHRLHRLARGEDTRRVQVERETKSVSAETTFDTDLADSRSLEPVLLKLSERVAARLKQADLCGRIVTLKLKTQDFKSRTRARTLPATQLAPRIFAAGRELLGKELDGAKFRLIGIGMSDLQAGSQADHGDLVDTSLPRIKATETAIDKLRARFGDQAVVRGMAFAAQPKPGREGKP